MELKAVSATMANRKIGAAPWKYPVITGLLLLIVILLASEPAMAQRGTRGYRSTPESDELQAIPRGEVYEQQFLDDFFTALGYRPQNLSWVDESETTRLLVTASSQSLMGDTDAAITTFNLLPDQIAIYFPFLTTMKEDFLVPDILSPWYQNEEARNMIFRFYEETWAIHPEYRDDYLTFRDDSMGRASRLDPDVPVVWILGHLSDYGFSADTAYGEDDPYLFLWDLLTGISYYSGRANYYGLQYDRYFPEEYRRAVVKRVGEMIKAAHDEASRLEVSRTFWGGLIDSYHPFETPPEPTEPAAVIPEQVVETEIPEVIETTEPETEPESLFRVPEEISEAETEAETEAVLGPEVGVLTDEEIESRISEMMESVGEIETPSEAETGEAAIEEEVTVETETPEVETEEQVPDEFFAIPEEEEPSGTLGNYAVMRLDEIASELVVQIGELASRLGTETIDLVMLYNDINVSDQAVQNAETRYIAQREAFLAGLAVWDRFDMEIYSPLSLADFNESVLADLFVPYDELKSSTTLWQQYGAYEDRFDEAFEQIRYGVDNRRNEPDVLAAESAALTAFLGEYNDLIKEIEDLISGVAVDTTSAGAVE